MELIKMKQVRKCVNDKVGEMCKDCLPGYVPNTSKTGCIVKSNSKNFSENEHKIINVSLILLFVIFLIIIILLIKKLKN